MGKFSSFIKGIVIGGGIALLLSPKTGKDLRRDLADKADEAMDKVMDYTETAKEKGSVVADAAKEASETMKTTLFDTVDTVKEVAKDTADQVKEKVKETTEAVKEKVAAADAPKGVIDAEVDTPVTEAEDLDPIEESLKTL